MGEYFTLSQTLLAEAEGGHHSVSLWGLAFYLFLTVATIGVLMAIAKPGLNDRVFKNYYTQRFEQLYLFVENMCVGIIGAHGRKYVPMMLTFWLVIFIGNVIALFMPTSPTAVLSFNLAMALISIGYVQYEGMRTNGVLGHFGHFAGPRLPIALAIFLTPMIFAIEILSEIMKNVSLSLRLFGNIHGGHQAVTAMNHLGESIYTPFGAFLLPIKLLTCVVQALIFTLLSCVYLSLVTQPHHGEGHEEAHAH